MDKTNFKDAYDIGENMAVLSGKGRSYTIINKETGKARQLVSEDGTLLVADNGVADFKPSEIADRKIKREKDDLELRLVPTHDIY